MAAVLALPVSAGDEGILAENAKDSSPRTETKGNEDKSGIEAKNIDQRLVEVESKVKGLADDLKRAALDSAPKSVEARLTEIESNLGKLGEDPTSAWVRPLWILGVILAGLGLYVLFRNDSSRALGERLDGIEKTITKVIHPYIVSVEPAEGPVQGNTEITVNGGNFDMTAKVFIGRHSALLKFIKVNQIVAWLPESAEYKPGVTHITVETDSGSAHKPFTYVEWNLEAEDVVNAPQTGGLVTIKGDGFTAGIQIKDNKSTLKTGYRGPRELIAEIPPKPKGQRALTLSIFRDEDKETKEFKCSYAP